MKKFTVILILIIFNIFLAPSVINADTIKIDFYKAFENHGSIILVIDTKTGAIVHANKAASDFYGYTIEQLESMNIHDLNILPKEEVSQEIKAAADEKRNYFVFKHRLANGEIRTVEDYAYPYSDGDKTFLVSIIHDITADTQLAERNKKLTGTFLTVLSGMVIFLLLLSYLLLKNYRKLKAGNCELNNFNELRKTFIDADNSLIYLKDENLKYIFINKALENYYKKDSSEIIGFDDSAFNLGEFSDSCRKTDIEALEKRVAVSDEVKVGNSVFQTTKFPVKLLNGQYGVGAYIRDVTEEYNNKRNLEKAYTAIQENELKLQLALDTADEANEQLQEKQYALEEQNTIIEELNSQLEDENERYQQQKEILQAIIDSLGAGVIMIDPAGKINFINKAWKEFFNYIDFGLSPHNENFYINSETWGDTKVFMQNMMTGIENGREIASKLLSLTEDCESNYSVDLEQTNPIKRFLHLYSNPCISVTNSNYGRVFVIRDISHQKELDRLKLELISTVSHELRTPMSSILGFSELMLTRKLSEERNREYTGIIHSEAKRLTDLINDFLDIQRMESGKQVFNKQYISIDGIIEEAVKLFGNNGDIHEIIYNKKMGSIPQVFCDRDKILQVMSNLLSNAVKYSPDGGEINIELTIVNGRARVSVTDHGLGIPEDVIDRLFTKFFRIDNDDRRKIGGSGLGLAICKEIVRAHGGEIGVESTYGQGSTFYFYLPCSGSAIGCESEGARDHIASEGTKGNLLIVEDDKSMVKLIKEILKDEGLGMHDVSSGEEALDYARKNCYKLIMLDIALNGQLSGWDVFKELKNNQATANIPIIISSVYENRNIAAESGIEDYLVKPFEPGQLINMVRKAFNGKLNSKMVVKNGDGLTEVILDMLVSRKIKVKQIEHSGNILIITLDGEEGHANE